MRNSTVIRGRMGRFTRIAGLAFAFVIGAGAATSPAAVLSESSRASVARSTIHETVQAVAPLTSAIAPLTPVVAPLTASLALPVGSIPEVRTDAVMPNDEGIAANASGGQLIPVVQTDPVFGASEVYSTGTGLTGTYVGTGPVRYIPAFQYQLLYSDPQGGYSCTAYSMAMAVDKATYGGSHVTGRQIRALTGVGGYVGLSLPDVIRASNRLYVPMVNELKPWSSVISYLKAGRGVVLQGDYDQIPDSYSGQLSFKGAHAMFLDHLGSTGSVYMMDPLQKVGARWIPQLYLKNFAEKLARQFGTYPNVLFAVTRTTRLFN